MSTSDRLHALDAVRAFALLLGVVFHAGFSFIPGMIPGVWAINDSSPSVTISVLLFTSHVFRMSLFFFIAGFFARMMFERKGARGFWSNRVKRILVPLVAGWVVIFPALAAVWIWGLAKTFGSSLPAAAANLPPPSPRAFPLTHLWFLYYLLVLYAIVLLGRAIVAGLDRTGSIPGFVDSVIRGAVRSRTAALLLAVPLSVALYFRAGWVIWFGVPTPDHSLIPELTSLVCFGTAVTFGWLVHRQIDLLQAWKKQWPIHLAGALGATALCVWMAGATPSFVPASPGAGKLAFAFCYSLAIWCWSFAVIGIAMRFFAHVSDKVRYVADASYWIYLVHLPVVAAMQVLVGHLPWHWSVKFPLILIVSFVVLFLSYRTLVRATFIGQVLNGRKYPRGGRRTDDDTGGSAAPTDPGVAGASASTTATPPHSKMDGEPVASLNAVHKRYGKTMALARGGPSSGRLIASGSVAQIGSLVSRKQISAGAMAKLRPT